MAWVLANGLISGSLAQHLHLLIVGTAASDWPAGVFTATSNGKGGLLLQEAALVT